MIRKHGGQRPNQWQGLVSQAKYDNPCREDRRMPQDVREITVERDENARFTRGDGKDLLIGQKSKRSPIGWSWPDT